MDDPILLSRIQFAVTICFHYLFPPLSIGLGLILVIFGWLRLKKPDSVYNALAKFWTRVFGIIFALGVASGIVMEFQFGTNWADYSRFVGDIFGSVLASEALFAFFLESGFLAILLFGWDKVGKKTHFFSTLMVCLGAHFSAIWIIVANAWMQTPAGYKIVEGPHGPKAEITSFYDVLFNPSSMDRLTHTLAGCWLAGATLVLSISAWYLLRNRHHEFAKKGIKISVVIGAIGCAAMLLTGDTSTRTVAHTQPTKFAAMEGVTETINGAPLHVIGIIDRDTYEFTGISLPKMLSLMTYFDPDAEVKGLNDFNKEDLPAVPEVFYSYHIMVYIGGALTLIFAISLLAWWKGWLFEKRWLLWCMVVSVLLPQFANQIGWMVAELGRQPWIVYGMLKTRDAVSPSLSAQEALASLGMFGVIYLLLFSLFIYQMNHKIQKGPDPEDEYNEGHGKQQVPFTEDEQH